MASDPELLAMKQLRRTFEKLPTPAARKRVFEYTRSLLDEQTETVSEPKPASVQAVNG